MSFADKMNHFADGMKSGMASGLTRASTMTLRIITGLFLGLTLALIGQEIFLYQTLSLIFMTGIVFAVFMRISRTWSLAHILIFDLVVILVAQLLRMYILLAP